MLNYRGWTLTEDVKTKLWTARRGSEVLPASGKSSTLRALIDQISGPEVRECCTGEACHG